MKVGDYVRTYHLGGSIEKIIEIVPKERTDDLIERYITDISAKYMQSITAEQIIKSSPNIIDLIEVGDYVNGDRVVEHAYEPGRLYVENIYVGGKGQTTIEDYSYELTSKYCYDEPDFIKSIVTKEQFSQIEYKVGE